MPKLHRASVMATCYIEVSGSLRTVLALSRARRASQEDVVVEEVGFGRLEIDDWRQFESVSIQFHPRLTVLTGANASGKSTLLGILSRHFNWPKQYSSAPRRGAKSGSVWSNLGPRRSRRIAEATEGWARIGSLDYASGARTEINVPTSNSPVRQGYDLFMPNQQPMVGVFLDSHRVASGNYIQVQAIPTAFAGADQLLEYYINEVRNRWWGHHTGRTPYLALKESLISAAAFGSRNNEFIEASEDAAAIWGDFQAALATALPQSLQFRRLHVRLPDVVLETDTGDFVIDDASGGVSAIIEVVWQIYLRSRNLDKFVVLLDEPENHLHPSLQRDFIPSLMRAFPTAQFVVATHSPFIVTAAADSRVYALEYNSSDRVEARLLDYVNKAASAEDTLTRVLGVPSTAPIWAEGKFSEIVARHVRGSLSDESLEALRADLVANGLESEFPVALLQLADRSLDSDAR